MQILNQIISFAFRKETILENLWLFKLKLKSIFIRLRIRASKHTSIPFDETFGQEDIIHKGLTFQLQNPMRIDEFITTSMMEVFKVLDVGIERFGFAFKIDFGSFSQYFADTHDFSRFIKITDNRRDRRVQTKLSKSNLFVSPFISFSSINKQRGINIEGATFYMLFLSKNDQVLYELSK